MAIDRGEENKALKAYCDKLPIGASEVRNLPKTMINAADMLPVNRGYFRFDGSLAAIDIDVSGCS